MIPSWIWFFGKLLVMIGVFIWVRGTLPRLRMDQLMNFAWKFMLPMALVEMVCAGVWHFLPGGAAWFVGRWLICAVIIVVPYVALARGLQRGKKIEQRVYRYAEES